jgi:hypothetical protein
VKKRGARWVVRGVAARACRRPQARWGNGGGPAASTSTPPYPPLRHTAPAAPEPLRPTGGGRPWTKFLSPFQPTPTMHPRQDGASSPPCGRWAEGLGRRPGAAASAGAPLSLSLPCPSPSPSPLSLSLARAGGVLLLGRVELERLGDDGLLLLHAGSGGLDARDEGSLNVVARLGRDLRVGRRRRGGLEGWGSR